MNLWDLLAEADRLSDVWRQDHTEESRRAWRRQWDIAITCPGAGIGRDERAEPGDYARCTPTVLARDDDWDTRYRGACLGCGWVAEDERETENGGAEDAHDHAWPGWRWIPEVPRPPSGEGPRERDKARERWEAKAAPLLPPGWLHGGGPIRTLRTAPGTRHVPQATPWGGYDMASEEGETGQMMLFPSA